MRRLEDYSFILGPLSLAALLAGVLRSLVWLFPWDDPLTLGLLIGGALLGALFILANATQVRTTITKRGTLYGLNAALMGIAFIAILVGLNYLAERYLKNVRYDFTEAQVHTLSRQSIQVVAEIEEPVAIVGFFKAEEYERRESFQKLLDQYLSHSDLLSYEVIDPDREPHRALQYEEPYTGLLLKSGGVEPSEQRIERAYSATEQDITGAILRVTSGEKKVVYFLSGHAERDLDDYGDDGYSTVAEDLRGQNYEVRTLNLAVTDTVPSDATVVVIASPGKKLLEDELERLQLYLAAGGRALIMQDPFDDAGLDLVLSSWQVRFSDGIAIDPVYAYQTPLAPATDSYGYSQITRDLDDRGVITIFPVARAIERTGEPAEITFTPLVQTSAQSWEEMNPNLEELAFDEADTPGPLTLVATVESPPLFGAGSGTDPDAKTRIVLVGDSEFASNSWGRVPGNTALFLNAVNWLAEEERLIAIDAKTESPRYVFLTDIENNIILFVSVIAVPVSLLAVGVVVWAVRRVGQ